MQTTYEQDIELSDIPTLITDQTKALLFISANIEDKENGLKQNIENAVTHLEKIAKHINNQEDEKIRQKVK